MTTDKVGQRSVDVSVVLHNTHMSINLPARIKHKKNRWALKPEEPVCLRRPAPTKPKLAAAVYLLYGGYCYCESSRNILPLQRSTIFLSNHWTGERMSAQPGFSDMDLGLFCFCCSRVVAAVIRGTRRSFRFACFFLGSALSGSLHIQRTKINTLSWITIPNPAYQD